MILTRKINNKNLRQNRLGFPSAKHQIFTVGGVIRVS
uniref:Uncharacterized protein n=1 Tax=Anguilla anguilla TaxID=7936 RepID=A0A0E9V244_ANGAN